MRTSNLRICCDATSLSAARAEATITTHLGTVVLRWSGDSTNPLLNSVCLHAARQRAMHQTNSQIRLVRDIAAMCAGRQSDLSWVMVSDEGLSLLRKRVYAYERTIPRGTVMSYRALAAAIGRPRAVRAVARAQALNPFPLVVPCHRIICADGSLGGFSAGLAWKIALLKAEGFEIKKNGTKWFVNGTAGTRCLL